MARYSESVPKIVLAREDLIAALEARRTWAQRMDARAIAKHEKAEKAAVVSFHKSCREALKWDYNAIKEHSYKLDLDYRDRPECPASIEQSLDHQLSVLRLDQRKTITVSDGNENSRIFWLLTHDERAKKDVCS